MADFTTAELRQLNRALEYHHDNAIHPTPQAKADNVELRRKIVAYIWAQSSAELSAQVSDRGLYIGLQQ